mmetsp:Transcript_9764/g.23408  ORF Transcript_9764/g.23408 Transcript_9764/m.23408 type:complete len:267 (-) Transcript_9764:679-1479(-)
MFPEAFDQLGHLEKAVIGFVEGSKCPSEKCCLRIRSMISYQGHDLLLQGGQLRECSQIVEQSPFLQQRSGGRSGRISYTHPVSLQDVRSTTTFSWIDRQDLVKDAGNFRMALHQSTIPRHFVLESAVHVDPLHAKIPAIFTIQVWMLQAAELNGRHDPGQNNSQSPDIRLPSQLWRRVCKRFRSHEDHRANGEVLVVLVGLQGCQAEIDQSRCAVVTAGSEKNILGLQIPVNHSRDKVVNVADGIRYLSEMPSQLLQVCRTLRMLG